MTETLAELDKQHTAKLVLDRLMGKPIKKRSPGFHYMDYITDGIDEKLPSQLPSVAINHLRHINDDLYQVGRHIEAKLANPKFVLFPTLQVYFKKKNIFSRLDLRVTPALHALGRINYPHAARFKKDYDKLYAFADSLRIYAKGLRPLKEQDKNSRNYWDEVLAERALELIEKMRVLCDAFLKKLRAYYASI